MGDMPTYEENLLARFIEHYDEAALKYGVQAMRWNELPFNVRKALTEGIEFVIQQVEGDMY